jgi:pimeloyl-ACP methyl ester carboxylesterase
MNKHILWRVALSLLLIVTGLLAAGLALADDPPAPVPGVEVWLLAGAPVEPGTPGAQLAFYALPPNFNGVLLIYCHGYIAPQEPLHLPWEELAQATLPDGTSFAPALLNLGFGFATTSYAKNGYAVGVAEDDLQELRAHVIANAPAPVTHTLLVGASEGGWIAVQMVEKHPDQFQGAMSMGSPLGGGLYQTQYLGDFKVIYDVLFPGSLPYGLTGAGPDDWQDWETVHAPAIEAAMRAQPSRALGLLAMARAAYDPKAWLDTAIETAQGVLHYSIAAVPDVVATAGGLPYGNVGRRYSGSWWALLVNYRVERITGPDPAALPFMTAHYEPTGQIERPVVVVHNLADPIVPYRHALLYAGKVYDAGRLNDFALIAAPRYGHVVLDAREILAGLAILYVRAVGLPHGGLQQYQGALPAPLSLQQLVPQLP